jgi:hypothetical protein
MATFEVWDMRTGNVAASFGREQEALVLVRDAVAAHGPAYAIGLALARDGGGGCPTTMADDHRLLARVRASA